MKLGIERTTQTPLIVKQGEDYLIWLSYNQTVTAGTYLRLTPSGVVTRNTEDPTGAIVNSVEVAKL